MKKHRMSWFAGLSLASLLAAPLALANATRLPSQDSWAVARGYAAVAGISSSAAVYYNPAGLAKVTSNEVRAGVYVIDPDIEFTSDAGRKVDEQSDAFYQPHVFAAVPLRGGLTLGAGVYSPFGQSTDWSPTSGFGGLATFNEIRYITGAVALGWNINPQLSVGAGLQWNRAEIDLNRLTAIAPGVITSFGYKGRDDAASGNIGIQWSPAPGHIIGAHYQTKTSFSFGGTAALTGVISQPGAVDWVFPDNIAVGWQWACAPNWQVEVSYDWTNWNRVNTLQLQAGPLSTAVPLEWKSSAYYGVGASYQLDSRWSFAAGYNYSENSVPDATLSPSLPDVNRHLLSAGVFWNTGSWEIHLVGQRGLPADRRRSGPAPDGLGGSAAGTFRNGLWAGELAVVVRF
jgi:long-chain fatty acid transport protein